MVQDVFYEITRRVIPLSKNNGVNVSWQDSVINVRTDKGMTFFEFSYNLQCLDKNIDILESSIPSPKSSPATELCKSKFIGLEMKNYDYTEMMVDSSFWPHNNALTQEMTNIIMYVWSPSYFHESKSVLAILNNIGGVEIFMQQQCRWTSIINMSTYMQELLKYNKSPKSFEELKQSVYAVETSAICWAQELNPDCSCYFVTAQKNGIILFWEMNANKNPTLIIEIHTKMPEILSMLWIPRKNNQFWLICSDVLGQINALDMYVENGIIKLKDTCELWKHKDRMIGSHLNYMVTDDNVVLIYSKHRHIVLQLLDENCKIVFQYVHNINDYKITAITNTIEGYYLATVNVEIFKLHINISEANLNVNLVQIALKESYPTYELYSLSFSNTNAMAILGMINRKVHCRKETPKIDLIFISTDSKLDSLIPRFLSNPDKKLTKYWDCIEALRYNIRKTKVMPDIDYNLLYLEGCNDVYKLKIYLFLLIIYLNLWRIAGVPLVTFPELSIETVKEKILLMHAQSTLDALYKKHERDGKLNDVEEESLYGCVKYLRFFSKKYKNDKIIDDNTYSHMKTHFKYICQSCDEDVNDDFTCTKGHLNMYCALSFTPITSENYLVCKCCGSTSRADLGVNRPLCVFCDQYLIRIDY